MKINSKATAALLAVMILIGASGCGGQSNDSLQASGIIEATEVSVAAELSGLVDEILVEEGEQVQAGDLLFRLDGSLLLAQREAAAANLAAAEAGVTTAQAAVQAAQAQYDLVLSAALAVDQANRTANLSENPPNEFEQPGWYFSRAEEIAAAQAEVQAAQTALDDAVGQLNETMSNAASADFIAVEADLARARAAYEVALAVRASANRANDGEALREAARDALDDAEDELDDAQEAYDDTLTTEAASDILADRADAVVARERYFAALDALRALQTGSFSPEVSAVAQVLEQAQTGVAQAQAAVDAAAANLALLDAQIEKLQVRAPMDGVVLVRSLEAGEVLQAGLAALTIGQLDEMTVVVYLPENRYGQVSLGDEATLKVDSYPDEIFSVTVRRIADQAEYTPRNVQTAEERQTTVYAVELALDNVDGKLKPGMQADITFETDTSSD